MKRSTRTILASAAVLGGLLGAALGAKAYVYLGPHDAARRIAATAQPGDIEMFSYTTCGICRKAKLWFAFHDVPYRECVADVDPACNARFKALRTFGTPTFQIHGRVLQGFDPERIAQALDSATPPPPH